MEKYEQLFQADDQAFAEQLCSLERLTAGMPLCIYAQDKNGVLIFCNDYMANQFNLAQADVIGKTSNACLFREQQIENIESDIKKVTRYGVLVKGVRKLYKKGKVLFVYVWIQACRDLHGEIKGVVCGYVDITEYQQLLGDFKEAKEIANCRSKEKTVFLTSMCNDICTPIDVAVGILELIIKKKEHDIFDIHAVELACHLAKDSLRLVGDVLDVIRMEDDNFSLVPERCNLRDQVESVVRIFDGLAKNKKLNLLVDIDSSVDCDVLIDPLRFKQVLYNILSNAIRFTIQGQISIKIYGALADRNLQVNLLIKDSGVGISAEDQQLLFLPFAQVESLPQRGQAGSGLGLVISRNLCELMGGALHLTSVLNKGTEVEMSFSVGVFDSLSEELTAEGLSSLGVLNILVVDDHQANRFLISEQLNYLGHKVHSVGDADVGLMYWRDEVFDVVVVNCNMLLNNDCELVKHIRNGEPELNRRPCTMLGFFASSHTEERDRCIAMGMDDCLFKPIGLNDWAKRLLSVPRYQHEKVKKIAPYHLKKLEKLLGKKPQSVRLLLAELINSNRNDLDLLLSFFDNMDVPALSELAHKIKGGALVIEATDIIESCNVIEAVCKCSDDFNVLFAAVSVLEEAILDLERAILPLLVSDDNSNSMQK